MLAVFSTEWRGVAHPRFLDAALTGACAATADAASSSASGCRGAGRHRSMRGRATARVREGFRRRGPKKTMTAEAKPVAFYGWRVAGAAFIVAIFGWGLGFYGPPIFLHAVRELRGCALSLVYNAVTT